MEAAQLAAVCATVRAFADGAGAVRVVLLLDTGDPAAPTLVELDADALEVTADGATLPYAIPEDAAPLPLPPLRPVPATAVSADAETGEWPPGYPEERRSSYSLDEVARWLEVFCKRFFAFAQFKRSALPNGPKVSAGGSLSPRGDWRAPSDGNAAAWLAEIERNVPGGSA